MLEELAEKTSCSAAIRFLGQQQREDTARRLQAADVFVLPSEVEGLSNAVLEAMASALPCVVSRISGNENLIVSNENGYLVDREDGESLSNFLLRLAHDSELAHRWEKQDVKKAKAYLEWRAWPSGFCHSTARF